MTDSNLTKDQVSKFVETHVLKGYTQLVNEDLVTKSEELLDAYPIDTHIEDIKNKCSILAAQLKVVKRMRDTDVGTLSRMKHLSNEIKLLQERVSPDDVIVDIADDDVDDEGIGGDGGGGGGGGGDGDERKMDKFVTRALTYLGYRENEGVLRCGDKSMTIRVPAMLDRKNDLDRQRELASRYAKAVMESAQLAGNTTEKFDGDCRYEALGSLFYLSHLSSWVWFAIGASYPPILDNMYIAFWFCGDSYYCHCIHERGRV